MSVFKKLSDAREKFHKLALKKTGHNKFAGYYYFELGDFLIPALSVFKECGLLSVISFGKEVATMKIIDLEKPDQFIVIESPMSSAALKGAHEIQNLGAVETYTRRYLWVAALEIVEHDAIDSSKPIESKKAAPVIPASPPTASLGLEPEVIQYLQEFAMEIVYIIKEQGASAALTAIHEAQLDNDQRTALNNMLDSTTRSALKKAKELVAA